MSAVIRKRHVAEYNYPGSFFPESITRELSTPTFKAAVVAGPDEKDGYFGKDGWYAVTIRTYTEKRFTADDDEAWITQGKPKVVGKWIVGDRIHYSDIEPTDANRILIANIECNSRDGGFGVQTRCGNWQIGSDYTTVVSPNEATA